MNNLNLVPLSALRAIETIVRKGTLSNAAEELGITAGALSQRLTKAEDILGQTLFVRTASGLRPTKICKKYSPLLSSAMNDLSAAVSGLRTVDDSVLTVTVAPIFASRWLIWRIHKFNEENPQTSIRIEPTVDVVELNDSEIDIGIRVSQNNSIGIGAIKLLDQRVFPICSPEISKMIKTPADLFKFPIIRENEKLYGWDAWLSELKIKKPIIKQGPTYRDASLCLDAAMTGQGIFMAWETLACDALERGQIVSPFPERSNTGATYWFAVNSASAEKTSVRKFREWLKGELEGSVTRWRSNAG